MVCAFSFLSTLSQILAIGGKKKNLNRGEVYCRTVVSECNRYILKSDKITSLS